MTAWWTVVVGAQTALKPGFPFNVYTVLYDACVTSISDYASEITGYTQYQPTLDLHTRAIRAFLGLPKNSCNVGVLSEVDWLLPEYRTQCKMIRQYSRILSMDNSRLTKQVYSFDKSLTQSSSSNTQFPPPYWSCFLLANFS